MSEEYYIYVDWAEYYFRDHFDPMRVWLNENIGRSNWQFCGPGSTHPNSICFQTREDALAFKLKFDL
jgi:hypothetical protein